MAGISYRVLVITALGIALLAGCLRPPASRLPGAVPEPTIAVSEAAAASLEAKASQANRAQFDLAISEQEVTSYLALRLGPSLPLSELQVHFQPGLATLDGDLTRPLHAHVRLTATARIEVGRLEIDLTAASLGGVQVPHFLLASVADSLTQMIADTQRAIEIERIEIAAGTVVLSGHGRQP